MSLLEKQLYVQTKTESVALTKTDITKIILLSILTIFSKIYESYVFYARRTTWNYELHKITYMGLDLGNLVITVGIDLVGPIK